MPHRLLRIVLHIAFFLSGIATVLIGQVLPIFARHFSLSDLQLSYFFPAQFAGSITGTYLTSRFAKRNDYLTATIIGTALIAAGILVMNVDLFSVCLLGFFVENGVGIGLTLPAINMLILEMNPERSGPALTFLNFCWGLGAIVCKPFVDLFSGHEHLGATTTILTLPLLVVTAILLMPANRKFEQPVAPTDLSAPEPVAIWRHPLAWMIALFNFIHVGFESGIGGWLTTYTGRLSGETAAGLISPTFLYFLFFVVGRGVAPALFRYLNENKMLILGLLIILAGMIVVLSANSVTALGLGATIAGFGTSWIFPTNVSRFSKTFGPTATRHATPLFIAGTLGSALSTWSIGYISDRSGSLYLGMYVLIVSVMLLIVLQIGLGLRGRNRIAA